MKEISKKICIIGAGPAGLGAAWSLMKSGERDVIVIDKNNTFGGLARTEVFDDNYFDIGPHRFFTKNKEVNSIWHEVLGNDFIPVSRLTRIYYNNKLYKYPISALDALPKMGLYQSTLALFSYLNAALTKNSQNAENFQDWVTAEFGEKLYSTFFKVYTEKVWGIPCTEISADWAAQRIKGLNLLTIMKDMVGIRNKKVKTLVDEFDYPRKGAGMMYTRMAEINADKGHEFLLNTSVESIERNNNQIISITCKDANGETIKISADQFITSIPITYFVKAIRPEVDKSILESINKLYYRDHITVNLIVNQENIFPDQWIYVHSESVKIARLANYNNFSKEMVRDKGTSAISVEYFTFKSDDIWKLDDKALIELAKNELIELKLVSRGSMGNGWVIRELDSYPSYFVGYEKYFEPIKRLFNEFTNCTAVGRGGMYRYNNMDHSLYTGLLAGYNLTKSKNKPYNIWNVNIDAEYHESSIRS